MKKPISGLFKSLIHISMSLVSQSTMANPTNTMCLFFNKHLAMLWQGIYPENTDHFH